MRLLRRRVLSASKTWRSRDHEHQCQLESPHQRIDSVEFLMSLEAKEKRRTNLHRIHDHRERPGPTLSTTAITTMQKQSTETVASAMVIDEMFSSGAPSKFNIQLKVDN
ncbi:hypothetical protein OPV22_031798 [Ensete ventricosum]|uniref:Uncharacterized protein n=1 Tax=Ensete ventricosum TaxID=4639 RepID=A0AAV8PTQ3_ENSVE|nr:hypothetical protein OPV22_031798 [Ensete ventricosum]